MFTIKHIYEELERLFSVFSLKFGYGNVYTTFRSKKFCVAKNCNTMPADKPVIPSTCNIDGRKL